MEKHLPQKGRARRLRILAAAAALVMTTASAALAYDLDGNEPFNNTPPWDPSAIYSPKTFFSHGYGYMVFGNYSIAAAGDVDHAILSCEPNSDGTPTYVEYVAIQFSHAKGDLDMEVATVSGSDYIGLSDGVTDSEDVDVPPGSHGAVAVKVYGYGSAKGTYTLHYLCL